MATSRLVVALFLVGVIASGGVMAQQSRPLAHPNAHAYLRLEDIQQVDALHQAGLKHDKSQLPLLLKTAADPPDHFHFLTAVHALARIGDRQALPILNQAIQTLEDKEARDYAQVARARLLAKAEADKHSGLRQQADARLNAFFTALGLDVASLHAAILRDKNKDDVRLPPEPDIRELYALRELADMIYHEHDMALADAAKQAGVNFGLDVGAKYKAQIAPLSSRQRVDWLINELSNKRVLTGHDFYLEQLAADEGKAASRAAAAKLKEMDQHRERYADMTGRNDGQMYHTGFSALFDVVRSVGDTEQEAVIAHFLNDKEKWIAYYAHQVYGSVKAGIPWKWRIGY